MAYRFSTIVVLLVLAFAYLGFHLYQLQLVKGGFYYAQAASEQSAAASNNADRGAIYFTDNNGRSDLRSDTRHVRDHVAVDILPPEGSI
jgi:cell division protein FtsI/penicillin-binding protein 2